MVEQKLLVAKQVIAKATADITSLSDEIHDQREMIANLEAQIANKKAQISKSQTDITAKNAEIVKQNTIIASLKLQIDQYVKTIEKL